MVIFITIVYIAIVYSHTNSHINNEMHTYVFIRVEYTYDKSYKSLVTFSHD